MAPWRRQHRPKQRRCGEEERQMHVAFPMIKTPIKYPCSRERLVVAEAAIRFGRAFNSELFDGYSATHEDATWVLRAEVIGHLSGRPMTTRRIARLRIPAAGISSN
jgi:hypothetical protein